MPDIITCMFSAITSDLYITKCQYVKYNIEMFYFVAQILLFFVGGFTLLFAYRQLKTANANNLIMLNLSKENNEIQNKRLAQERLIELSHEWNSLEFVTARNRANANLKNFKGNERDVSAAFNKQDRQTEWIDFSLIAHFFERLSYIHASKQLDVDNSILEFYDVVEHWCPALIEIYGSEVDEDRLITALSELYRFYKSERKNISIIYLFNDAISERIDATSSTRTPKHIQN